MSNTPVVPTPHAGPEMYLGRIHDLQFNRDCVHVACFQVELDQVWDINGPATMLRINNEGKAVPTDNREQALGILDPFIQNTWDLNNGDKVWLILFPGMIRSLSHYWEHDAFPPAPIEQSFSSFKEEKKNEILKEIPSDKHKSYEFLCDVAEQLELSLEKLLYEAKQQALTGDHYYIGNAEAEGFSLNFDFWVHYQNYTDEIVPPNHQQNFISCSC